MSEFFRTSRLWVVDFRFEGRARRWLRAFGPDADVRAQMELVLRDLYDGRAALEAVREATADEELAYLRGEVPANMLCPTGRLP